jgi:predicted nucleotidyltransferase
MVSLTQKEREVLLALFKDFTSYHNANSISRVVKMSHVGAQKMFRRFAAENLVTSRRIGKAIVYKPNVSNHYLAQLLGFLLADEANRFRRWKEEFKGLFKTGRIILMFGSAIKDYAHASDIDLMIVMGKKDEREVNRILKERAEILPKKLHAIKLTRSDLLKNVRKREKPMVDIVKNAVALYGQEEYVEVMNHVAGL